MAEELTVEQIGAFQCQVGPSEGSPHTWQYRQRPNGNYLCTTCLARLSKTRLKELTDNA